VTALDQRIEILFAPLQNKAASFPSPAELVTELVPVAASTTTSVAVPRRVSTLFASAAVEMWLRAVHSFLISASLSRSSALWASVAGYYASHYVMRAFAHLLGWFQLFAQKRIIILEIAGASHVCNVSRKRAGDGEHKIYWRVVKNAPEFAGDPFFTYAVENADISDLAHRGFANYADHIDRFEPFTPLDEAVLRDRINHLSSIELTSVPTPDRRKYADLDSVQLIAYHRLIKLRSRVDQVLGGKNKFWNAHRTPTWAAGLLDFQLTEPSFVSAYGDTT
jgi:hypothetical protein